jgi:hypothetical protein
VFLAACWVVASAGCGGNSGPIEPPSLVPEEAAAAALAEYDTNKDGVLDEKEIARCPGLKNLAREKNNRVSAADIAARLTAMKETKTGTIGSIPISVVWADGRPVAGATVTLVPEKFLGSGFKSSSGTALASGEVGLQTSDGLPGCQLGFFKVQVSLKDAAGQEQVPARYNENTGLGCEVNSDRKFTPAEFRFVLTK